VAISRECTRAEAQAFMTRVLQDAMSAHRRKEKEEAKERRRVAKAQKRTEEEASSEQAPSGGPEAPASWPVDTGTPSGEDSEEAPRAPDPSP